MKLVASLIVRDERGRYLEPCVEHLLGFCDELRILDDGSTDGSYEFLAGHPEWLRIRVLQHGESEFFAHEGRARQALLDWTLAGEPTHVLAIDADEFVAVGAAVRAVIAKPGQVWTLDMEEIWQAYDECLCVREDGGWRTHPVPILYAVPARRDRTWRIANRALACGREPMAVTRLLRRARPSGTEVLHFGWTNEADRAARHHRYVVADGGRYHANAHLKSILAPNEKTMLRGRDWPAALEPVRAQILDRCSSVVA